MGAGREPDLNFASVEIAERGIIFRGLFAPPRKNAHAPIAIALVATSLSAPAFAADAPAKARLLDRGITRVELVDMLKTHGMSVTDATTSEEDPWLSPDGRTLVFASNRGGAYELYIARR